MERTCVYLRESVGRVSDEWGCLTSSVPWLLEADRYQTEHAPRFVLAMVEAAICQPRSESAHRAKVQVAAEYGAYCAETGLELSVPTAKFALLREAFWRVLKQGAELSERERLTAILWIDAAYSLLTRASMVGYHKAEFAARGQWPGVLDEIARTSPLLQRLS